MGSVPMKHHVYSTDNCLRNLLYRCSTGFISNTIFEFLFQVAAANMRSEITKALNDAIADEKSAKDIIADVKEIVVKTGIAEQDVVVLVMRLNVEKKGYLFKTRFSSL